MHGLDTSNVSSRVESSRAKWNLSYSRARYRFKFSTVVTKFSWVKSLDSHTGITSKSKANNWRTGNAALMMILWVCLSQKSISWLASQLSIYRLSLNWLNSWLLAATGILNFAIGKNKNSHSMNLSREIRGQQRCDPALHDAKLFLTRQLNSWRRPTCT